LGVDKFDTSLAKNYVVYYKYGGIGKMKPQSCLHDFMRYTTLSVLGTLGVSCYILADTFFISKGLGTDGLTALNLAIPVYNFIHGSGLMIGMGGATRFSVMGSRGEKRSVDEIFTNTVYLAILFSVAFVLAGAFMARPLALMLGADNTVIEMTVIYLRWLLLFAPAFIFNDVFLCFVRNDGGPQLSMAAMLIGNLSNIVLDYIFIFPLHMGMFGAILATDISPVISIIIMSSYWLKRKNTFHLVKVKWKGNMIGRELSLGFPSLLAQVSTGIVMIIFNVIILELSGNTGVAAYGVTANISLVVVAIYTGIAQGIQPLISDFYGRGDSRQIYTVFHYAVLTVLAVSLAVYLFIFVFAQPITAVFNSENNAALQQISVTGLRLYFLSAAFTGYNIILAVFFTSVEKAIPAHILSVLRGFVLVVPFAFLLSALWEMTGVWLACPLTELVIAVIGYVLFRHCRSGY